MTSRVEPVQSGQTDLLKVENVSRSFRIRRQPWAKPKLLRAVDDVTFTVSRGETVALVGESGAGKTTVARLVLCLDRPDSGHVMFDGCDVHRLSRAGLRRHHRRVQAVFQDPWSSLDPRMRVAKSIAEPLRTNLKLSRPEIRERIRYLMDSVGLSPDSASHFPNQFSGGQRQRIALARALAPNPDLIVLDEPVSSLDVSVRAQIMNLLADIQAQRGVAYMMISHDLATVRFLAHSIGVMYLGALVEFGPAESVFRRTRNPYTRSLITAATPGAAAEQPDLVLSGDVPSPINPPSGCPLHTRCWLFQRLGRPEVCIKERPRPKPVAEGHVSACHFDSLVSSERPSDVQAAARIGNG